MVAGGTSELLQRNLLATNIPLGDDFQAALRVALAGQILIVGVVSDPVYSFSISAILMDVIP